MTQEITIQEITIQENDGGFTLTLPTSHPLTKAFKALILFDKVANDLSAIGCYPFRECMDGWLYAIDILAITGLHKLAYLSNDEDEVAIAKNAINTYGEIVK